MAADPALQRLADQVRAAVADRTPLEILGTGTKGFYGGALPSGVAATRTLDVRPLEGICSYEPSEMVITVRAGTLLAEVEEALAAKGQQLAFEPPRFSTGGTIGGMVAAGLSGPARACVGGLRDFVLGISILNGRGQVLRFGGQVMKNVAGYDISRLMAGSLGVLGVICDVSLKVPPVPAANATLVFSCDQVQALDQLHRWTAAALPINASAWRANILHLRLAGAAAAVGASATRLANESGGRLLEDSEAWSFWVQLRDQSGGFFGAATAGRGPGGGTGEALPGHAIRSHAIRSLWRLSVPATHPPLEDIADTLVEWGGAQRWFYSDAPAVRLRELAAHAGGHATLFRAAQRSADFQAPLSPAIERIHRALKASFDPAGIFNPGRLYPWL